MELEDIYSRFLSRCKDKKLLSMKTSTRNELLYDYLEDGIGLPYVRDIFQSVTVDQDFGSLDYELRRSIGSPQDSQSEDRFVKKVLVEAMVIAWMSPEIDNLVNLAPVIGGKEEKVLLNNYKPNIERQRSLEIKLQKYIRDHAYYQAKNEGTVTS